MNILFPTISNVNQMNITKRIRDKSYCCYIPLINISNCYKAYVIFLGKFSLISNLDFLSNPFPVI